MLRRRFVLILAGSALASACGRAADDEEPSQTGVIRFAVETPGPAVADKSRWGPLFADLGASAGMKIRGEFFDSAASVVAALRHRRADLALMSSAAALAAVRRNDGEVFARSLPGPPDGGQAAVLITGAHSRLSLAKVLGCDRKHNLGLVEGGGDQALLAADAFLFAPLGIGPAGCFRVIRALTPPRAILSGLADRSLDLAILGAGQLEEFRPGAGPDGVRELWRSPPLPSPCLVWRRDLDPAIKEKLRRFFLTYGQVDGAQRQRLLSLGLAGFAPADNSHLLIQREMDAAHEWLQARAGGDKARQGQARAALDAVTAERRDLEARTGVPAGAQ